MCALDFTLLFMKRTVCLLGIEKTSFPTSPQSLSFSEPSQYLFITLILRLHVACPELSFLDIHVTMDESSGLVADQRTWRSRPLSDLASVQLLKHQPCSTWIAVLAVYEDYKHHSLLTCYISDISSTVMFQSLTAFHLVKNVRGMRRL